MKPNELFNYLRNTEYNTIGVDLQYKVEVDDNEKLIRIMFQESKSKLDWILNFYVPVLPNSKYLFSRGWQLSWNSGNQVILEIIKNRILEQIMKY